MGESRIMTHQRESAEEEEVLVERIEVVDTEQSGGSEPGEDPSGNGSSDGDGDGEENAPWHNNPND